MTKKQSKKLAVKAKKLLKAREIGRSNYACADRLLSELRAEGLRPGDEIVMRRRTKFSAPTASDAMSSSC
jgi:hypothetical protein